MYVFCIGGHICLGWVDGWCMDVYPMQQTLNSWTKLYINTGCNDVAKCTFSCIRMLYVNYLCMLHLISITQLWSKWGMKIWWNELYTGLHGCNAYYIHSMQYILYTLM